MWKHLMTFLAGSILTKGVKVNIMENTTPYSQWNEFRALFADMYKDPAQVIMTDFHQIYPELMDAINFPKFSKDYFKVSSPVLDWKILIRTQMHVENQYISERKILVQLFS